ncbi:MAG: hypothetical protein Q9208_004827 [Pyrenodesmia sp. 3 TL-2023]
MLKSIPSNPRVEDVDNQITVDSWWTGAAKGGQEPLPYYHIMCLSQAIKARDQFSYDEKRGALAKTAFKDRIPVVAVQILAEILSTQNGDGTWDSNNRVEDTIRHAVLALLELASLPYTALLSIEIRDAISKGHKALSTRESVIPEGSQSHLRSVLDIHPDAIEEQLHADNKRTYSKRTENFHGFVEYFSNLDHIKSLPRVRIKACILEASLYRPFLKSARGGIFPSTASKEQDKYLDYIPIMWLLASASYRVSVPPEYLLDMMILSMWIFLTDEYMESKIIKLSPAEFRKFRKHVEDLYNEQQPEMSHDSGSSESGESSSLLLEAKSVFTAFAKHVHTYPRIISASPTDLLDLRSETRNYLLHHLQQLEDNLRLTHQPQPPPPAAPNQGPTASKRRVKFLTPRTSFQTWVHTSGAGHISGPFAWAFFACCMSGSPDLRDGQGDCFRTPRQKLMAHGMNAHYGAFCRLYNDYGSVARDAAEGNLNSVNFPEFFAEGDSGDEEGEEGRHAERAKGLLLGAARYERDCALGTAELLCRELEEGEGKVGRKLADRIRVYIGAGEQFSDMYLTRDVTNSVK